MYLIFRSKDEWSWARNETWIRRKGNLLKHWRKGHSNGFKQLLVIWNLHYPGNQIGFFTGTAASVVVMSWDGGGCTMSCLFAGRLGQARGAPACSVQPHLGWLVISASTPWATKWLPDLALIHLGRCWCLLTPLPLCPLNRGQRAKSKAQPRRINYPL